LFASAREADCDFIVNGLQIEVGGMKKKIKKADFVIRDNTDVPSGNILPLWLLGFAY
jgi:hypothetical protein